MVTDAGDHADDDGGKDNDDDDGVLTMLATMMTMPRPFFHDVAHNKDLAFSSVAVRTDGISKSS